MIGKVLRGRNVRRLLYYLYGPGLANEHADPHLVAGFSDPAECERCLLAAGLVEPEVRQLPLVWRVTAASAVFDAVSRGGVRTAAVLRAQTPDALDRIRRAAIDSIEQYARGETFNIPMPAMLASGSFAGAAVAAATSRGVSLKAASALIPPPPGRAPA